jgi:hypothetical protein
MLQVSASPSFNRVAKKLLARDKKHWMKPSRPFFKIRNWAKKRKCDRACVLVYKVKLNGQETLLAYELQPDKTAPIEAMLLAVGPHENFYAGLKR